MKKILSLFLITCMFLGVNVFAADDYKIVDMKEFSKVGEFSEGLCAVQDVSSRRWGFVDVNKNWVISPRFQNAEYFENETCVVNTVDGETVLINRNGDEVFKFKEYHNNLDKDRYYTKKHGKYKVVFENKNVTLLSEDYSKITPENVNLVCIDKSQTVFKDNTQNEIYNYKGINITERLKAEDITLNVLANNKYIVGRTGGIIKCFDINGNKIEEFDTSQSYISDVFLTGDIVEIGGNDIVIYNIQLNKCLGKFDKDVTIKTYYDKFFTVAKNNGTSALYSFNGDTLIDFGKWNTIYPSAVSNTAVVLVDKYGIADYNGNLLIPLEYSKHKLQSYIVTKDGKYTTLTKDGKIFYTINMTTLKQYTSASYSFDIGYKYHRKGDYILDNNLNEVYCHTVEKSGYEGNIDFLAKEGIMRLYYQLPARSYGFLMFEDSGVKVKVDDTLLNFDVLPVIQNGRTLVPMRAIFEALGANVEWNGETQSITAKNKDVTIQMQIGNNTLTKNGQSSQIDVSPQLIDGRTMVPVRAISDCFNVLVDWNGYTQTVSLFTN